jgi:hypothetical protein
VQSNPPIAKAPALHTRRAATTSDAIIANMSCDRDRLHALIEEVIDPQTAAKLDLARAERGEDVPLEEVRRRLGL